MTCRLILDEEKSNQVKIGVLGGGFGLYGYCPSISDLNHQVVTLEKYRTEIAKRPELKYLLHTIEFVSNSSKVIESTGALVYARLPFKSVGDFKSLGNSPGHIFLEKPLGASPQIHKELISELASQKRTFSIAYLSKYTQWYKDIIQSVEAGNTKVTIKWSIAEPKNAWKIDVNQGGGAFTFYGIHFFELLSELGITTKNIKESFQDPKKFYLKVESAKCEIDLTIDISGYHQFQVEIISRNGIPRVFKSATPFGVLPVAGDSDPRRKILSKYIEENLLSSSSHAKIKLEQLILDFRNSTQQHQ